MKSLLYRAVLACTLASSGFIKAEDKITVFLDDLPPYIITASNEGVGIKIAEAVFKDAGIQLTVKTQPFLRSFRDVQSTPNTCILPLERSQERETQFEWISPFLITTSSLYSSGKKPTKLVTLNDVKESPLPVGVVQGSAAHKYLESFDIKVETVVSDEQNLAKLVDRDRLSFWATDTLQGKYLATKAKKEIKESLQFFTTIRALACNLKTDHELIVKLRKSITKNYADGTIGKLIDAFHSGK